MFNLDAKIVDWEVEPGKIVKGWSYNGQIPGPLVRVRAGQPFVVDVINDSAEEDLVHWHGLPVSTQADGAAEEGRPYVMPKGQLRVNFTPNPAGNRWYHTHIMAMDNMARGAYTGQFGFLYIEPKKEPGAYDQEHVLAARHWEAKILHRGDPQNDWTVDYDSATLGTHSLGHGEPIRVKKGQRVMFRFLNASATRDINLALPGHKFHVVALDGNPVPNPADVDVLTVYDPFTVVSLMQIEDMGFCAKGDAGPFAASGALAHDSGVLPFNTHGGLLSHAYVLGIAHVVECVKQLRGTAAAQVPGCEIAVYGGYTGHMASTLVLGKA